MTRVINSLPSGLRISTAIDRFPLFIPAQKWLCPLSATGQRFASNPPSIRSKRITSAPICANVIPANGTATNADPSTTRIPLNTVLIPASFYQLAFACMV